MSTKEDYAQYLAEQDGADSPKSQYQDYLREQVEAQVQDLKQRAAKGEKPPLLSPKAPNPRREALEGSKKARQVGLPPGTLEAGIEAVGATGGATAGALYGTQLGAPLGPMGAGIGGFLGGVAGAGLGLAGTRSAVESGKALVGARPPVTADEAIERGQRALMEGIAGESVFRLGAGIPQGYRALKRGLLAGTIGPEERALYHQAQGMDIHLSPDVLTDSKAPKMVGQTLRRTLAGGGKFEARDIENELNLRKAIDGWAEDALGKYAGPVEQGELIQRAIKGEVIPEHREMVGQLYKELDQKTGGARIVDTTDLYSNLQEIRNSLARRGDTHAGALSTIDDVIQRITKKGNVTGLTVKRKTDGEQLTGLNVSEKSDAPRQPVNLTFHEAQEIRSIIGSEIGQGGPALPGSDIQKLKKSYALMTEEMGKSASGYSLATGKNVNLDWALADTMNRRGKELFNESVMAKVLERDPEKVVGTVFKKDAITPTRDLVRSLETKPEVLGLYRRSAVEELIKEATNKETERVVGTNFAKAARKRGEAVLKETFGEHYPAFKQILEVAERMPKDNKQGLLWFEQGLYISGMMGALGGHALESTGTVAAAAAIPAAWFITTRRLAEIMTNKDLTGKLLQVGKMDPKSAASLRLMSQLGAIEVGETGRPVEGRSEPRRGLITGIGQTLMQ